MSVANVRNARIVRATLGYESRGMLTSVIELDFGGSGQAYGNIALDDYDVGLEERVPSLACGSWVAAVLRITAQSEWASVPGLHVRVRTRNHRIDGIGHIMEDRWMRSDAVRGGGFIVGTYDEIFED